MADPTTAAEWQQVSSNASSQLPAAIAAQNAALADVTAAQFAVSKTKSQYSITYWKTLFPGLNGVDPSSPGYTEWQAARVAFYAAQESFQIANGNYSQASTPVQILQATIKNADSQAAAASSGAPATAVNTPPTTVTPGQSNTTVTTPVTPVVTSPAPPAEQPASEQTTPQATNEISAAQVVPLVNEGNAGEDAAAANVGIIKSIDVTGIDEQIAANAAADAVIADQVAALSEQNLETPPDLMADAIQAQQEADQDYAFSTGYNNVQDQKDAENQQALDQIEAEQIAADEQAVREADSELLRESRRGLTSEKAETQATANAQDATNFQAKEDWRVRLSLSPGANYLYKAKGAEGILLPLVATDGIIFPYTPNITVVYAAHYEPTTLTHSNYKIFQYGSSSVDNVTITAEFTAQDTFEANYLLAVIHFFRSVTKMFYGNDQDPLNGTPPPLCYLSGLGEYQFDAHPLVITSFNYTLPTDVDYVRAGVGSAASPTKVNNISASTTRLGPNLTPGGLSSPPAFSSSTPYTKPTYVPTKMQIAITAYPVVTRSDISNNFSLTKYATGELLQGTKRKGGGIW